MMEILMMEMVVALLVKVNVLGIPLASPLRVAQEQVPADNSLIKLPAKKHFT